MNCPLSLRSLFTIGFLIVAGLLGAPVQTPLSAAIDPLDQWTELNTYRNLNSLFYANGRYLAATDFSRLLTSTDGLTWERAQLEGTQTANINGMAYGNGLWVVVG